VEPDEAVRYVTTHGKVWDAVCLWCGDPLSAPEGRGRPKVTCCTEHRKKLATLRQWFDPIKLRTHDEVDRAQRIREKTRRRG
jgi:hypothetical protein